MFARIKNKFLSFSLTKQFLLAGLLLSVLRSPRLFYAPRFWAEEGNVFFAFAKSHSWGETLTLVKSGYFNLTNNLSALISAWVPLAQAPFVSLTFSFLVLMTGVWVIASIEHPLISEKNRWILFFLYFFSLNIDEIWMNTINLQSYYCAILFLIGFTQIPFVQWKKNLFRLYIFMTAFSGPNGVLAAPAFIYVAWKEKSRERALQAGLLCLCASTHAFFFFKSYLVGVPEVTDRFDAHSSVLSFFPILFIKSFVLPLAGPISAKIVGNFCAQILSGPFAWVLNGLLAAITLFSLYLIFKVLPKTQRIYSLFFFTALFTSIAFFSRGHKSLYLNSFGGGRYFYTINFILFSILFFVSCYSEKKFMKLTKRLVFLAIAWGVMGYCRNVSGGPSWRSEVKLYEQDHNHILSIWPVGWTIELAK